ncbi:NAD-dependent epimerase/dehydratase family protein [Streptomyces sp. NPDC059164]|uniref:NAD-dependent epimerase/dehydratase family protein n=1 Tax=unclassified Streptomyces TaxID=2593676 RepID=UPI001C0B14DC|nr:NAD(P)-dependent oxidoreductase [Streptomyces sp. YPW6]QWQ40561.1 NAD(P)-dependent oxidoreductase [Streptomyces sp. YPW6]
MRILVLGSTGYLGAHVAERLGALHGTRVLTGGRSAASDVPADLATDSAGRLAEALAAATPDAVVNCAGATGGNPVTLAETNTRGPAVLCEAMELACPSARLVHLGSAAEYGPGTGRTPATESAATRPLGAYGATKLAGTAIVTASALDALVLRVGNPVGPGAPPGGLPGRVARLLRDAGADTVLRLGDLSAYRDFVDARDVARAAEQAVTAPGPLPRVLNIGGGRAVPVRELVHTLAGIAGFGGRIEEQGAGSARSGQVSWQCSDISAAGTALGWRPSYALRESLTALWSAGARRPVPCAEGEPSS